MQAPQQQRTQASSLRRTSLPVGNVQGDWTHDLHDSANGNRTRNSAAGPSLASRIQTPSSSASLKTRAGKRAARIAAVVSGQQSSSAAAADLFPSPSSQINILRRAEVAPAKPMGMTIRGLAGPFAVLAQNFAPGTTEADIESAMTPVGGEMVSCRFVKTQPILIVEMVFASREGGERVIETFNDKTVRFFF